MCIGCSVTSVDCNGVKVGSGGRIVSSTIELGRVVVGGVGARIVTVGAGDGSLCVCIGGCGDSCINNVGDVCILPTTASRVGVRISGSGTGAVCNGVCIEGTGIEVGSVVVSGVGARIITLEIGLNSVVDVCARYGSLRV